MHQGTMNTELAWVLHINHKHGDNITIHRTEAGAQKRLAGYVDEWWEHETTSEPKPDKPDEAVAQYFQIVEPEYYELTCQSILE